MKQVTTEPRRNRFQLTAHRRVGLFSLACLVLGAGWVASAVLPGLEKANAQQKALIAGTGDGWMRFLSLFDKKSESGALVARASHPDNNPAVGTLEVAFVNAPVGLALQQVLTAGRYTSSTDPSVSGVVSYSCANGPKPFWEVVGRIIGAAPAPGVHIAPVWDSYRVFSRNVSPMMASMRPSESPLPKPIPIGEGHVTHRVAGYVALKPNDGQPRIEAALLETRIPGVPPQWRSVRVGDSLQRKSSEATAQETDAAANIDVALMVSEVTPHYVTLRGGGNKSLRIPLSDTGTVDTFGFSPDIAANNKDSVIAPSAMPHLMDGSPIQNNDSENQ